MSATWIQIDPRFSEDGLGYLWDIIQDTDTRSVKEQLNDRYRHGGGFRPMNKFTLNKQTMVLKYPGDPPFKPVAMAQINNEKIYFYPQGTLLMILQKDGSFEVTRVD